MNSYRPKKGYLTINIKGGMIQFTYSNIQKCYIVIFFKHLVGCRKVIKTFSNFREAFFEIRALSRELKNRKGWD